MTIFLSLIEKYEMGIINVTLHIYQLVRYQGDMSTIHNYMAQKMPNNNDRTIKYFRFKITIHFRKILWPFFRIKNSPADSDV